MKNRNIDDSFQYVLDSIGNECCITLGKTRYAILTFTLETSFGKGQKIQKILVSFQNYVPSFYGYTLLGCKVLDTKGKDVIIFNKDKSRWRWKHKTELDWITQEVVYHKFTIDGFDKVLDIEDEASAKLLFEVGD